MRRSNTTQIYNSLDSKNSTLKNNEWIEEEYKLLNLLFHKLTQSNKFYLTPNDLRNMLEKLNITPNRNELFSILCDYDINDSGGFSFEEFKSMINNKIQPFQKDTNNDYLLVFKKLDYSKKGYLTKQTWSEGFLKYGFRISKDEVDNIFKKIGNNKWDFENFKKIIYDFIQKWNNKNDDLKKFK